MPLRRLSDFLRDQIEIDRRNQLVVHGAFHVRRQSQGFHLRPDREKKEGERSDHRDEHAFRLGDLLETMVGQVHFRCDGLQANKVLVQCGSDCLRASGSTRFQIIRMVVRTEALNGLLYPFLLRHQGLHGLASRGLLVVGWLD